MKTIIQRLILASALLLASFTWAGSAPSLQVAGAANVGSLANTPVTGGSFTFQGEGYLKTTGSGTTQTVQLTGVNAGELIVVMSMAQGGSSGTTVSSVSDGTSTLTTTTLYTHSNNDLRIAFSYIIASVASGSVTYTTTWSETVASRRSAAMRFSYTGSVSFDDENGAFDVTSSVIDSGDITTTAAVAVVLGGWGDYGPDVITSPTINGVSPDGQVPDDPIATTNSGLFYRIVSATFTGAFEGAIASQEWVANIISFKAQ